MANPITAAEEPKLHVEISVLSRNRQIGGVDEIKIGRDGLIIERGRILERGQIRALFLPQVPAQQGWNLNQYLVGLCRKAGLPADAWKAPGTRIYRFTAQVFGEPHATTAPAETGPKR